MSSQGLETIDHTVHLTHEWINELARRLDWGSKRSVLHLLRVVLHQIRDRLSPDELAQFSAQLPMLLRGMLFEGWVPKRTPNTERNVEVFAREMADLMNGIPEYRGVDDVTIVFDLLNNRISRGEVEDIRGRFPESLRALWTAP